MPDTVVAEDPQLTQAPQGPEQTYTPVPSGMFSEAPSYGEVSRQIMGQLKKAQESQQQISAQTQDIYKEKGQAMAPAIESAITGLAKPRPTIPGKMVLPPAPQPQIHDFLAPLPNETPQQTLTKMFSAMTTLGAGIGGLAKGDARAALASLTGALTGWQQGDKERAAREYDNWRIKSEEMIKNSRAEWDAYYAALNDHEASNQDRMNAVKLLALKYENPLMAAASSRQDMEAQIRDLMHMQTTIDGAENRRIALNQSYDLRQQTLAMQAKFEKDRVEQQRLDREEKAREADIRIADIKSRRDEKEQEKKDQDQAVRDAYTPEVLEQMGREWIVEKKAPTLGGVRSGLAAEIRGKAYAAGMDWARKQGIDPNTIPAVRAEAAAARTSLIDLDKRQSQVMSFVNNFDKASKLAQELSEKVDRTGMPVLNRWLLKLRGEYAGDEDVAKFELQNDIVAMEYSKIMVANAQGDANTRANAREKINTARTKEQYRAIIGLLGQDTTFRRQGYDEEKKVRQDFLKNIGGGSSLAESRSNLPPGTKMEGGELVSESGKYVWRNGAWQSR